jgi:hypothetical protein
MAKATQTDALVKAESTAIARPAFLDEQPIEGFEGMDNRDTAIARLALAQSMSRAVKKSNSNHIPGLEEGMLYNSLTKTIYGTSVRFIPLFFFKNRIMFKDLDQGGGILCMAADGIHCQLNHGGACLHGNFGPNGEKPECTEFFNYPALLLETEKKGKLDEPELIVLSFKSTAMKKAKEWNSRMRMLKSSMFAQVWDVRAIADKKDQFDFFNVEFNFAGFLETQEVLQKVRSTYQFAREGFGSGTMTVDAERPDETDFPHGANSTEM